MTVAVADLPQPGPCQLEVQFRRLLMLCEAQVQHQQQEHVMQQQGQHLDLLADVSHAERWRTDPKFHCYVDTLQEQLYDLEHGAAEGPAPDVVELYKKHVRALVEGLRPLDLPPFCRKVTQQDRSVAAGPVVGGASSSSSGVGAAVAPHFPAAHNAVQSSSSLHPAASSGGRATAHAGHASSSAAAGAAGFSLSQSARERLATQQWLQDDLTGELVDMTQELKAGALAMQNAVRFRGKVLDDAEDAMEYSTAHAKSAASKAKEQYQRSRWSFCQTCLVLLAVGAIFAAMIVYIKLTSMVGLGKG